MLAVAAARRHVQMRKGLARLAVEPRQAFVAVGARLFAIVAADAQILVDQERVGRLAEPFLHDEARGVRIKVHRARIARLARFDEAVHLRAFGDRRLGRLAHLRPRGEHLAEAFTGELDQLCADRGLDRGIARRSAQHAHFAEEAACRKIAEEDRLPADILLDHHRPRTDYIDVVALLALGQHDFARGNALDFGGVDDGAQIVDGQPALEDLEQLAFERDTIDRALRPRNRRHQLQRRGARHLDEDAVSTRPDRRAAFAARDQPDLAEYRSLLDRHGDAWPDLDLDEAVGDREQRRAGFPFFEHDVALAVKGDLRIEHEFTHLQRRHVGEDADARAQIFEPLADRFLFRQALEDRRQILLVRRGQVAIAVDELDDVIALVHAMLDQRITRERADHENAGHRGFKDRRQLRKGFAVGPGELDPHRFHEAARRDRPQPRNDHVARDRLVAVGRLERQETGLDLLRLRLGADAHQPVFARLHHVGDILRLGAREILRAVEDRDGVFERFLGDAERIFDPRVARPDDGDMLVLEILGIVDLIDDVRQVGAFAAHPVRIALRADRQHDIFCRVDVALRRLDREGALLAAHFGDLGVIGDLHLVVRGVLVPIAEDIFARAFGEAAVRTQVEPLGGREHALAFLIFEDGVGEVIGLFEQDMAHPELPRARRGAEACGPRADDRDLDRLAHAETSPRQGRMSKIPVNAYTGIPFPPIA